MFPLLCGIAASVIKCPQSENKKKWKVGVKSPLALLDYFAYCESWSYGVYFDLHVVARFGLWNKDYEAFDPCDSVTATAGLFDVKLVFLAFLNWFVDGTFKAHSIHLIQLVQLVLRDKTKTSTRMVTEGRSLQPVCLTY
jgi:hypothetical protein